MPTPVARVASCHYMPTVRYRPYMAAPQSNRCHTVVAAMPTLVTWALSCTCSCICDHMPPVKYSMAVEKAAKLAHPKHIARAPPADHHRQDM